MYDVSDDGAVKVKNMNIVGLELTQPMHHNTKRAVDRQRSVQHKVRGSQVRKRLAAQKYEIVQDIVMHVAQKEGKNLAQKAKRAELKAAKRAQRAHVHVVL